MTFAHVMDVEGQAIYECSKCGALVREERIELHREDHEWQKDTMKLTIGAIQAHIESRRH